MGKEDYRSVWGYLMDVPFRLGFIDAGGVKTRFLQAGEVSAPPLILLHGMNGSLGTIASACWQGLPRRKPLDGVQ